MPWGWELSDYGDCEIQVWEDEHCEGRYLGQLRHVGAILSCEESPADRGVGEYVGEAWFVQRALQRHPWQGRTPEECKDCLQGKEVGVRSRVKLLARMLEHQAIPQADAVCYA